MTERDVRAPVRVIVVALAIVFAQCTADRVGVVACESDADCSDGRVCQADFTCGAASRKGSAGAGGASVDSAGAGGAAFVAGGVDGGDAGGNPNGGSAGSNSNGGSAGGNAIGGNATGGNATGGNATGGNAGGAEANGGSIGAAGAGAVLPAKCLTGALTVTGAPRWALSCVVLTVASVGGATSTAITGWTSGLTAPWHVFRPDVFTFGPGQPHSPPYDDEVARFLTNAQLRSTPTFSAGDFSAPSGVAILVSVVPSADAVTGSSPDFASGPIIPNTSFPMLLDGDLWREGQLIDPDFDGHSVGYDKYSPPVFGYGSTKTIADGMSHFIMVYGMNNAQSGGHPVAGAYKFRLSVVDSTGSGWLIEMPFTVQP